MEASNHFTIIIPSYNCRTWVPRNLLSVFQQEYKNYDLVYVDDASTDGTGEIVNTILEGLADKNIKENCKLIVNDVNKKAINNLYDAINSLEKENTIIVALDGDDWFAHPRVLTRLNDIYCDDVWITAGSYIDNSDASINRPEITEDFWSSNIRTKKWTLSHLRTFRKKLFQRIDKDDLLDDDDNFYKFTWDRVLMYPMVEMAGPSHFKAIPDVMYTYNSRNPINVHKVHREEQLRIEKIMSNKKPYERLESL